MQGSVVPAEPACCWRLLQSTGVSETQVCVGLEQRKGHLFDPPPCIVVELGSWSEVSGLVPDQDGMEETAASQVGVVNFLQHRHERGRFSRLSQLKE